jgi:hypothetical protein
MSSWMAVLRFFRNIDCILCSKKTLKPEWRRDIKHVDQFFSGFIFGKQFFEDLVPENHHQLL